MPRGQRGQADMDPKARLVMHSCAALVLVLVFVLDCSTFVEGMWALQPKAAPGGFLEPLPQLKCSACNGAGLTSPTPR
jgi:hypothetical protein